MERLKRLADELTVVRGALGNIGRSWSAEAMKVVEQAETILRSASAETVGKEWTTRYTEAQARGADAHNADLAAARLAVANAKAERDAAINLAYQYPPSEPYNPDGVTWRQMYEMLDEKSLGDKHGHDCAVAALTEQRDAALARVAELEAKQPRQWTNNRPKSIASYEKWWQTWMNGDKREYKDRDHEILRVYWRDSDWARDSLWLPYVEGDTRDNLPPLPNSSATLTGSPSPATAEAKCGLCGEPMPPGEEMFQYHGYSGPCPNPQSKPSAEAKAAAWCNESPRKRPARRKGER